MPTPSTRADEFYETGCQNRKGPKTAADYAKVMQRSHEAAVTVDSVTIFGLCRTRDWLVKSITAKLRAAKTFDELKGAAFQSRDQMARHGIFKEIDVELDRNTEHGASTGGVAVTINVEERGLLGGKVRMDTTAGEARGLAEITLVQPTGNGETVSFSGSQSTGDSSTVQVRCSVPISDEPDWAVNFGAFQNKDALLASHAVQQNRGLFSEYKTWSGFGQHLLRYDAVWRHLMAPSEKASFAVREEAGHSLKSSISHIATFDRRDSDGLGSLYTLQNEAAGFGGDCHFLKHTAGVTHRTDIGHGCVLRLSCRGGLLDPLPAGKIMKTLAPTSAPNVGPVAQPHLVDRFFLGGCTDVRGFATRGIGPRERDDALGGDAFIAAAAHLYTPIPIERLREQNDRIRCHFFANGGSCVKTPPGMSVRNKAQTLGSGFAVAVGAGLAVQMTDTIDLELNYCVPVLYGATDSPWQGVQFGISLGTL